MTNEQAKKMIRAKLECLKRETSGTDFDCNNSNCDECSLCYEQGNMGEQKEALDMAIKALEQQPCEDTISRQAAIDALEQAKEQYFDRRVIIGKMQNVISNLPSAQPDGIPLEWIDKHLEWLDNCDNDFAQLAKVSIKAMVELWKKDRI